jgi:NADPH:quinone reductase-like Zn-dependent oxidoreductase
MKAARINQWGEPVQIEDLPQPTPGDGEVLVRVHAGSINPIDGVIAAGYMAAYMTAPLTLGTDFSGEVAAVGAGVSHVKPGDAVFGMSPTRGTFAEYDVIPANGVALKPKSIDDVQAAAVPLNGLTARQTLFNLAKLQPGERILIHGAGGGVGRIAVQLAKNAGAYVIAHDRGDKEALLRELGVDQFINAETQRFEDEVTDLDVILDYVGRELVERSWAVCRPGSRYVTSAAQINPDDAAKRGFQASGVFAQANLDDLNALASDIDAGRLKVLVAKTFPLAETQTALGYKDASQGKAVVTIG